ncbi:hypothetical protein pb186bvf_014191 [Paramecium bursaria]
MNIIKIDLETVREAFNQSYNSQPYIFTYCNLKILFNKFMINVSRFCQVQGHQGFSLSHICTYQGCNQQTRWACTKCFAQQAHQHNQKSNSHIMNQQQFNIFITHLSQNDYQDNQNYQIEFQQYLQLARKLIQKINQLEILIQGFENEKDNDVNLLQMQKLIDNDFYSLNNYEITEILNKKFKNQNHYNLFLSSFQQIARQTQEIEQSILKNIQSIQQMEIIQASIFKDYTKLNQNYSIFTAQMSQNEQYLAYGGYEQKLVIHDVHLDKEIKSINLDYKIYICRFSDDSKLLYVGCWEGYLLCIDIANNYKQIYNQRLNKDNICNLIEQSKKVIISSHKTCIIRTNIKLNQQLLKIDNAHIDWIYGLDYNSQNDILVTGSQDQSIKFFKIEYGLLLIEKKLAHNNSIYKIQLTNSNKLISLSSEQILKVGKQIIKTNVYYQQIRLQIKMGFTILIMSKYVKVLDKEFKVIKQINHSQYDDVEFNETNQLQSMNYLIISGHKKFTVIKRQLKEQ